jgi:hypothetical protein
MRALVAGISMCASAAAGSAQSFSASGQVGYLQEWELKASLARTVSAGDAANCNRVAEGIRIRGRQPACRPV